MPTQKSPGVIIIEKDYSVYAQPPQPVSAAMITPTVRGAAFLPTTVTSYNQYVAAFGSTFVSGSDAYEYFGSLAAKAYFENGGKSLLVVPIATGSYANATSTILNATGSTVFTLETISDGAVMNNSGSEVSGSNGALTLGNENNIRWETSDSNVSRGTFTLTIRRGDDNSKKKIILESFSGVNLDPMSNDYIARRVGDQNYQFDATNNYLAYTGSFPNRSNYVRVASVSQPTPYYFDGAGNPKANYTGSLPTNASGAFSGGADGAIQHPRKFFHEISSTNSQGFGATTKAYDQALDLLSNNEEYKFNLLILPGITAETHPTIAAKAVSLAEAREDCFLVLDLNKFGADPSTAVTTAAGFSTSYAGAYYPWVQIQAGSLNKAVWCPPSTLAPAVYAYTENTLEAWFAPAGLQSGGLPGVINVERKVFRTNRDTLYEGAVNPIKYLTGVGYAFYGQKTLQKQPTSLDRINVRLMAIKTQRFVRETCENFVFQQNTVQTQQRIKAILTPYFDALIQKQGIFSYTLTFGESTPDMVDRNTMLINIAVYPTDSAEFIQITYELRPTNPS